MHLFHLIWFVCIKLKGNIVLLWLEQTRTTRTPAFWDTSRRPMITHTSDSHQIPSQNNTKSKLHSLKSAKNSNFEILQETLHVTHLLKLLDKMYKYEMDPTRTVGATEQTLHAGWTDGQMDGRSETNIPPYQLRCARGIIIILIKIRYYYIIINNIHSEAETHIKSKFCS